MRSVSLFQTEALSLSWMLSACAKEHARVATDRAVPALRPQLYHTRKAAAELLDAFARQRRVLALSEDHIRWARQIAATAKRAPISTCLYEH